MSLAFVGDLGILPDVQLPIIIRLSVFKVWQGFLEGVWVIAEEFVGFVIKYTGC